MLIVRLDAVGDALTVVPAIAALRAHGARIGIVLRQVNAQAYAARAYDRLHIAGGSPLALTDEIRGAGYDYALIATEKPDAYRLAYGARIPVRVGFENGWGKPLKTLWARRICTRTVFRTAGLDPRAPHECDVVFSLAQTILPDAQAPRDPRVLRQYVIDSEPAPDPRTLMQITDKWERLGAQFEAVLELARRVRERTEVRFVCSSHERSYGERFAGASGHEVEYFDEMPAWKNAIAAARAVVAPDSGAVHVAGMTGTPVVACFAPAHFAVQSARWSPWAAPYDAIKMEGAWPLVAADALQARLSGSRPVSYTG